MIRMCFHSVSDENGFKCSIAIANPAEMLLDVLVNVNDQLEKKCYFGETHPKLIYLTIKQNSTNI